MDRKRKITLSIVISVIVIISGFAGALILNHYLQDGNPPYDDTPPVLVFPVENINSLEMIYGYNMTDPEDGHNGIDFITNITTNIIASCNMTVNDKSLSYNEIGAFWQAGVSFDVNDAYELFYAFENFAENETAGTEQLDAITVEIGQEVVAGQVIGQLIYASSGTHIHYMLHKNGEAVCPYLYFSPTAKSTFDTLWPLIGTGVDPCNITLS
ncbi:MAG: M23 family metallopeptidase [Promethearchaeota archaeon]